MANEVFISYSRKDFQKVREIKKVIDQKINIDCWMDITGIESGERFKDVIISAINRHDTMLFMMSKNSMISEFALDELDFATHKNKRVILISIDGAEMIDTFYFTYKKMNIIYWDDKVQRELLINNLESWFPSAIKKYPTFFRDENYKNRILHVIFFIRRSGRMFGHKMEIVNEAFSKVLQDFDLIKPDVDILLNVLEFGGNVSWMKTSSVPIEDFKWEELEARGQDCFDLACQELDKQLQMIKKHSEKCKTRMIRPFILLISNNDSSEEVGPYLQQLLTNRLFLESERYAIYLDEDFNPDIMKTFTGKKSKVFHLTDIYDSKPLTLLINRLLYMGLYAGSACFLDESDNEYPIINEYDY